LKGGNVSRYTISDMECKIEMYNNFAAS
jgi:hypothetical protein